MLRIKQIAVKSGTGILYEIGGDKYSTKVIKIFRS